MSLRGEYRNNYRFVVQVWCTASGWADSLYGGETKEAAELSERLLREENGAWINPAAPKQTRIVDKQQN